MRFKALLDRYQHIIRLALFGHNHFELFHLFRSVDSDKPIGVAHAAAAASANWNNNPAFRILKLDTDTLLPIEITTYYLDLEEHANTGTWQLRHSFPDYYGMSDLKPSSFDKLTKRFLNEENMAL